MGWSEVAARSHARRLEAEGWLERQPMTRGQGSLFFATRTGVRMTGVPLTATSPPAPTWWAHHCACAWAATWLTVRGRTMLGSREVLADPCWSGQVTWRDAKGFHRRGHRPDLVAVHPRSGGGVPLEVELAQKSANRLRAILDLHAAWRSAGKTGGVLYICADTDGCSRIRRVAAHVGLRDDVGRGGLRLELLETIKAQAIVGAHARRDEAIAETASCAQLALFDS
jgi:hypothetical protein